MKTFASAVTAIVSTLSLLSVTHALTVDEVIKLKRSGVSDSTIELLIKRGGDARSAGVWKQDGWIIHSTESRFPDEIRIDGYYDSYPIDVYPQFHGARRHRSR